MKTLLPIYLIVFLMSCNQKKNEGATKLYEEVMSVHDEVMPKMDDIHDTKKKLAKMLSTIDSTEVFSSMKKLDEADEAMMTWMEDFDADYDKKPLEEQQAYLNIELEKIKKVKLFMLESIEAGNHLIQTKNPK